MKRIILIAGLMLGLLGVLPGCSIMYYRTARMSEPDRDVSEFGLIGWPDVEARKGEFCGLVPLWRSTRPVNSPTGEKE